LSKAGIRGRSMKRVEGRKAAVGSRPIHCAIEKTRAGHRIYHLNSDVKKKSEEVVTKPLQIVSQ